ASDQRPGSVKWAGLPTPRTLGPTHGAQAGAIDREALPFLQSPEGRWRHDAEPPHPGRQPASRAMSTVATLPLRAPALTGYKPFWAKRFGPAPYLPMSRAEMEALGWDSCDVVIVTGDAYVDHPRFGMAVIGRVLEAQGFRVGIIAQPDWHSSEPFKALGRPNLFWGEIVRA